MALLYICSAVVHQ